MLLLVLMVVPVLLLLVMMWELVLSAMSTLTHRAELDSAAGNQQHRCPEYHTAVAVHALRRPDQTTTVDMSMQVLYPFVLSRVWVSVVAVRPIPCPLCCPPPPLSRPSKGDSSYTSSLKETTSCLSETIPSVAKAPDKPRSVRFFAWCLYSGPMRSCDCGFERSSLCATAPRDLSRRVLVLVAPMLTIHATGVLLPAMYRRGWCGPAARTIAR